MTGLNAMVMQMTMIMAVVYGDVDDGMWPTSLYKLRGLGNIS